MKGTLTMTDYPITPTPFTAVSVRDAFWLPRLETNRMVTIPDVLRKCEEFGRVDNFRKASRRLAGAYRGKMPFDDTEVYKAIEGASFSLAQAPAASLEARLDALIDEIAAAQESDGYLYTNRTIDPAHVLPFAGEARWTNLVMSHELYNCGHLYEAACAHHLATGKRGLLDVALRSAELICQVFGPAGRHDMCGHQIVEMGLARLYRVTKDRRFLEQARFFLEQRGRHEGRDPYMYEENPGYCQDHAPVVDQREAVGHAVRAAYMYCGMADVAALLPDPVYAVAIEAIWRDVVESKIYLTGAIGARHRGEAFGEAYELPNLTAYGETCASIGSVMWNHRLFLLTGDARYVDVLEQTLYNGLLAGVSLKGDEYFYTNPMESDGKFRFNHGSAARQRWFDVSCCPTNICRFFPSLPGYIYASSENVVYANLFIAGRARLEIEAGTIEIVQETQYPWSGSVRFTLNPGRRTRLQFLVRIPGWASDRIMGGSLYRFEQPFAGKPSLRVNGKAMEIELRAGYAVIEREWEQGDSVELDLPMPARKVLCDPRVSDNRGKAALQRGPIVYCVEGRDAQVPLDSLCLGGEGDLAARRRPDDLGGIVEIRGDGFRAIPYYAWANRGPGPMRTWLWNGRRHDGGE
jgi:DUF1680 family protein